MLPRDLFTIGHLQMSRNRIDLVLLHTDHWTQDCGVNVEKLGNMGEVELIL